MTVTEFETEHYSWVYHAWYGVGRFIRRADGAMTLLDTGTACQATRRYLRRLWGRNVTAAILHRDFDATAAAAFEIASVPGEVRHDRP